MSKHVLDRPRAQSAMRARKFLEAERRAGLHPAIRALFRRKGNTGAGKVAPFFRIVRARMAEA